jgi:hypothetical protein
MHRRRLSAGNITLNIGAGRDSFMPMPNVLRAARRPAAIVAIIGLAASGFSGVLPTAAQAAGTLHATGTVFLGHFGSTFNYDFAESPSGAVFYSSGAKVYVVKGTSAPVQVVQATGNVLAVAANSSDLFVDVGSTVTAYRLPGGIAVGQWRLDSQFPTTSAGLYAVGSTVWGWTDFATDESGFEYAVVSRFTTSSPAVHLVSANIAYPADVAANANGLYYEAIRNDGTNGYVVHVTPSGSARRVTDVNVDGPLALAGGRVELLVPHFSNGNTYLDSFNAKSLARAFSRRASDNDFDIAGTGAGLLLLASPCLSQGSVCSGNTVSQLSTATGAAISTLRVPDAVRLVTGPSAAVITARGDKFYLERLAA